MRARVGASTDTRYCAATDPQAAGDVSITIPYPQAPFVGQCRTGSRLVALSLSRLRPMVASASVYSGLAFLFVFLGSPDGRHLRGMSSADLFAAPRNPRDLPAAGRWDTRARLRLVAMVLRCVVMGRSSRLRERSMVEKERGQGERGAGGGDWSMGRRRTCV